MSVQKHIEIANTSKGAGINVAPDNVLRVSNKDNTSYFLIGKKGFKTELIKDLDNAYEHFKNSPTPEDGFKAIIQERGGLGGDLVPILLRNCKVSESSPTRVQIALDKCTVKTSQLWRPVFGVRY